RRRGWPCAVQFAIMHRESQPGAKGGWNLMANKDFSSARATLSRGGEQYEIFRLDALEKTGYSIGRLPYSLRILLENLLRHQDDFPNMAAGIDALARWRPDAVPDAEIQFTPARVLLQDFTGVPSVVDLAAMRDAMQALGGD